VWTALSEREREVVRLSAEGLTDAAVGAKLGVAAETVRSHWKRIRKRLGGVSRAEVVRVLALEESNPYRELFESLLVPVFYGDDQGRYVDVNPAALELLGYTRDEMVGRSFRQFIPPGTEDILVRIRETFAAGGPWEGEFPMIRKGGEVILLRWRSQRDPRTGYVAGVAERA
jgi:PAS domain S-box-containing protein